MKTTIFYKVTFLAFFVGKFFNDNVKIYFTCQLFLDRKYGKISQPQGANTKSYLNLDQFYFRKTPLTGSDGITHRPNRSRPRAPSNSFL